MKIELDISGERLANLMTTAIESGDPVTTAARGGWCNGIFCASPDSDWYTRPAFFDLNFRFDVVEVDDENTGHEITHHIDPDKVKRGLAVMAEKFPHYLANILADDIDAPTADIFLQAVVFGEEKYA